MIFSVMRATHFGGALPCDVSPRFRAHRAEVEGDRAECADVGRAEAEDGPPRRGRREDEHDAGDLGELAHGKDDHEEGDSEGTRSLEERLDPLLADGFVEAGDPGEDEEAREDEGKKNDALAATHGWFPTRVRTATSAT